MSSKIAITKADSSIGIRAIGQSSVVFCPCCTITNIQRQVAIKCEQCEKKVCMFCTTKKVCHKCLDVPCTVAKKGSQQKKRKLKRDPAPKLADSLGHSRSKSDVTGTPGGAVRVHKVKSQDLIDAFRDRVILSGTLRVIGEEKSNLYLEIRSDSMMTCWKITHKGKKINIYCSVYLKGANLFLRKAVIEGGFVLRSIFGQKFTFKPTPSMVAAEFQQWYNVIQQEVAKRPEPVIFQRAVHGANFQNALTRPREMSEQELLAYAKSTISGSSCHSHTDPLDLADTHVRDMSTDQISLKKGPLVNIRVKSSSGEIEYGYLMARPDGYYAPNAYDPEETLTASAFTFRLWKKYVHIKGQLRELIAFKNVKYNSFINRNYMSYKIRSSSKFGDHEAFDISCDRWRVYRAGLVTSYPLTIQLTDPRYLLCWTAKEEEANFSFYLQESSRERDMELQELETLSQEAPPGLMSPEKSPIMSPILSPSSSMRGSAMETKKKKKVFGFLAGNRLSEEGGSKASATQQIWDELSAFLTSQKLRAVKLPYEIFFEDSDSTPSDASYTESLEGKILLEFGDSEGTEDGTEENSCADGETTPRSVSLKNSLPFLRNRSPGPQNSPNELSPRDIKHSPSAGSEVSKSHKHSSSSNSEVSKSHKHSSSSNSEVSKSHKHSSPPNSEVSKSHKKKKKIRSPPSEKRRVVTTLPSGDQPKRKRKGSWPGKRKEENHEEMKPFLDGDSRRREMEEGGNSEKGESKKMNRKTVPGVILRCPAFQECQEIQKITVLKRFNSRKLPHLIVVENIAGDTKKFIYKEDDDISMDVAVMRLLTLSNDVWVRRNLFARLRTYSVVACEGLTGFCECVPGDTMLKFNAGSMDEALGDDSEKWNKLAASIMGVIVTTAMFDITDRHHNNVMFTPDGDVCLIDLSASLGLKTPMDSALKINPIYYPQRFHKLRYMCRARCSKKSFGEKVFDMLDWNLFEEHIMAAFYAVYNDPHVRALTSQYEYKIPTPLKFHKFLDDRSQESGGQKKEALRNTIVSKMEESKSFNKAVVVISGVMGAN